MSLNQDTTNVSNDTEVQTTGYFVDQMVDTENSGGLIAMIEIVESCVNVSVGIVGLLGAIVVILVYTWRHNPTPSELIITALSVVDLLYNVGNNIDNLVHGKLKTEQQLKLFFAISSGTFSFTLASSFLLISTISINRWFAICRPLTYMISFSKRRVRNVMLGIFGVSLLQGVVCFVYIYIESEMVRKVIDVQNYMTLNVLVLFALAVMFYSYFHILKTFKLQNEKLRRNNKAKYQKDHQSSEHDGEDVKPGVASTSASGRASRLLENQRATEGIEPEENSSRKNELTLKVDDEEPKRRLSFAILTDSRKNSSQPSGSEDRRSNGSRGSSGGSKDPKNKVTFTLFVISTCFLICVSPFLVLENILFFLDVDSAKKEVRIGRKMARILFLLNFVSNPIIYLATSEIFRERLVTILRIIIPAKLHVGFLKPPSANGPAASRRTSVYTTSRV